MYWEFMYVYLLYLLGITIQPGSYERRQGVCSALWNDYDSLQARILKCDHLLVDREAN